MTWLLKESLGGDSKTVMLATVSPCAGHVEETLATLRYACQVSEHVANRRVKARQIIKRKIRSSTYTNQQARTIVNTARISEDPNARLVQHLREQIRALEEQMLNQNGNVRDSVESLVSGSHQSNGPESSSSRVQELESELQKLKDQLAEALRLNDVSWRNKLVEAETKRARAEQVLADYGLSNSKDPHQPCLVNVNQVFTFKYTFLLRGVLIFVFRIRCSQELYSFSSDLGRTGSVLQNARRILQPSN